MVQLDIFREYLPKKAYSCDQFDVDNKVRALKNAIKKRYIQPNDFNSTAWLVYDIDRPVCPDSIRNDNLAPEPTVFVQNPKNGHAHLFYLLRTPVHQNDKSSQSAIRYAAAVDYGLAIKLDADLGYAGLLAKNALHEDWRVIETIPYAWELEELADNVDLDLYQLKGKQRTEYGLGRNCMLFDDVSRWSYRAIRQGWPQYEQWHNAVLSRTEMLNCKLQQPMSYNEYKHIAKSIANWTYGRFSHAGFSKSQASKGKRGGIAKGKAYTKKRLSAISMHTQGLSFEKIAKHLECSPRSISNWIKNNSD